MMAPGTSACIRDGLAMRVSRQLRLAAMAIQVLVWPMRAALVSMQVIWLDVMIMT